MKKILEKGIPAGSRKKFQELIINNGFDILETNNPFLWSMLIAKVKNK